MKLQDAMHTALANHRIRPALKPAAPPTQRLWPDMAGLLKAFRRRWLLALTAALLLASAGASGGWYGIPNRYTAFAQLRVASAPQIIAFKTADVSTDGRAESVSYLRTQAALIRSRLVLGAALRMPGIAQLSIVQRQPEAIAWLEEELKVEYQENSELLRISLSGEDPVEVTQLVNAIKDAYLNEVINKDGERRGKRHADLGTTYNKLDASIRSKRTDLDRLAGTFGSNDPVAQAARQQMWLSQHNELQRDHSRLQGEIQKLMLAEATQTNRLQMLEKYEPSQSEIDDYCNKDPLVHEQTARLAKLQDKDRYYYNLLKNDSDPFIVRIRRELASAEEALEARKAKLKEDYLVGFRERSRAQLQNAIADCQGQLVVLKQQESNAKDSLTQHGTQAVETASAPSSDLEYLQQELKQLTKVAQRIADERDALSVELDSPARVQALHAADVPQRMEYKKKLFVTALLTAAGFALGLLSICWLEFLGQRVDGSAEISECIGLRVVGSLPPLPARAGSKAADVSSARLSHTSFYHSIDEIRTMLLGEAGVDSPRTVMVTSAMPGEGKTTLASQLASSLARAGHKTLLVDYDLQKPALHDYFGAPLQPGLSELVCNQVFANDTIHATATDGLWLLPAGAVNEQTHRALAQNRLTEVLQVLRGEFEIIVIDSCPILASINAHLICQRVDAVILSVLRNSSRLHQVSAASQRLQMLGANVLGAVFAGEREKAAALAA